MAIFDTHSHLLDESFNEDREKLLTELPELGMEGMIEIGVDVDWSARAAQFAAENSFIYASAGVHPHEASGAKEGFVAALRDILVKPKVVAIGEIGLDYHYDLSPREVQRSVFEAQLQLAKETGKPVIIHMRKASEDTMALLKKYKGLRGVMHCYSGSLETAKEALKLGFYISFSGSVTFKNAVNLQPVAEYVPLDRILAETDCPYLTPEPFRGRRNDPSKVRYVLEKLAELKKMSYDEMCAINIRNARELFGITAVFVFSLAACGGINQTRLNKPVSADNAIAAYEPIMPYAGTDKNIETGEKAPADTVFMEGLKGFSDRLSSALLGGGEKNSVCSPTSLYMALSLAATGANGRTRDEILSVLGLSGKSGEYLSQENAGLFRALYIDNEITKLKTANSLWMQNSVPFKKDFIDNATKNFYVSLYSVSFSNPETPKRISKWISDNTSGVLSPNIEVTPNDILHILNTVYLKDEWTEGFSKENTGTDVFHLADGTDTECSFMRKTFDAGGYFKGDGFASFALEMKNAGSLMLILPDDGVKLQELLGAQERTALLFKQEVQKFVKVNLSMPKFSFGSDYDLIGVLKSMGIAAAFGGSADFSAMTDVSAQISKVRQQAHIATDENGLEAAAFTQIVAARGMPPEEETFDMKLDRPFIFAVYSKNGVPLFTGVVANPAENG